MVRYGRILAWTLFGVTCVGLPQWFRPVPVAFEPLTNDLQFPTSPLGLTSDGTSLFVSTCARDSVRGGIFRIGTDGTDVRSLFDTGLRVPWGLTVEGDTLYVIDSQSGPITDTQIFQGPKDGSAPLTPIYTGSQVGEPIVHQVIECTALRSHALVGHQAQHRGEAHGERRGHQDLLQQFHD